MTTLVTHPTATAQWYELVNEAETAAAQPLVEELESYLVFLLMRFTRRPEIADTLLALEYLNGAREVGRLQQERLKDVGDQCLLFSGLFPQQAERRRVKASYFVDLGRCAYLQLSTLLSNTSAELYAHLSQDFVPLMDVLHVIGKGTAPTPPLLQTFELWQDTGSRWAFEAMRSAAPAALPVARYDFQSLH